MRKIFISLMIFVLIFSIGAQDSPKLAISGNIYTGLRANITKDAQNIYANQDANGTPIWANVRLDYSFDANAGAVLNFRTKANDAISASSGSRVYPFLNRGYVWMKPLKNDLLKIRSGYLWDSDFESSANGWDTASNYEWVTEFVSFPIKNLQLGVTIPTPVSTIKLTDSLKDITYGIVFSPEKVRVSAMGQYGSVEANRSLNFGIDYTGVKNVTMRFEGDLQKIGIKDVGYYQLYQQLGFALANFTPDLQITETIYKDESPIALSVYPNITATFDKMTYYAAVRVDNTIDEFADVSVKAKLSAQYAVSAKSNIKVGAYFTKTVDDTNMIFSPFIQLFASF